MEDMNEFKQFDIVCDDSDHHFRYNSSGNNMTNNTKKSIIKEWNILEQNLPESIYVRVYERIELMRAMIIGVAGTPYHDGLFFFDIMFPSDYPNNPPKVHFNSFGQRLNPNLYSNGTVCLSLINTWRGQGNEKWNPSMSTCLQLLLSLQGLVLNENPFFNEPGFVIFGHGIFDGMPRFYNECAYKSTCYINMQLLRTPPKNFDVFVKSHFRDRARMIVSAFIEYATERVRIGYYGVGGGLSSPPYKVSVSVSRTYKKWAPNFYSYMINAFEQCGASLDTYPGSLVLSESTESTIWTKAIGLIKGAFAWISTKK